MYPSASERVDYEGELAVVIGRICKDIAAADAAKVIFGYTVGNDVTARDLQATDGQWARSKGFDTFCPLGPWIETEFDPASSRVTTELDGEVVQDQPTSDMVFDVPTLIAYVSSFMTLLPGDVILTGTPSGIGPMAPGQSVSVTIDGIGTLTNRVVTA
jgi:2-keto-4-pentenoate hydratase/2-oxohepta-3-ene-1,7-dioic acid hydratase in catechol pathway